MTLERVSEEPQVEAREVVEALVADGGVHARAALRAIALLGDDAVWGDMEVGRELPPRDARGVGTLRLAALWRAESDDVVVHLAWLTREDGPEQSFTLVSGPERVGAPLLGGGIGTAPADEGPDAWRDAVVAALGTRPPVETTPDELLAWLRRGAATNAAVLVEVSAALGMGVRIAGHVLGSERLPVVWSLDETETDDERASYLQRLLLAALADGVDPNDRTALERWHRIFQTRRPKEQLRRLGLGGVPAAEDAPAPRAPARPGGEAARRAKRKAARKARKRNR
jgi:hypothetical protein